MRQRTRISTQISDEKSPQRIAPTEKKTTKSYASGSLLAFLIAFRLLNAFLCLTRYVPDEHWQSLEVAHKMVFKGHLTWEWKRGLRGYTHPLLFALLYKLLDILGVDTPWMMAETPKLLQGLLAAVSDWYVYRWSLLMFSSHSVAKYTLLCQCLSWFTFYCSTRTLSNTMESSLTPVILYYWWRTNNNNNNNNISDTIIYLLLASLSVLVRPTGVVMWIPLALYQLVQSWVHKKDTGRILILMIAIGSFSMSWSLIVDRIFYGKWVFVQLEFLKFNILSGQSVMFGAHPWHWYITQGLPAVLFTSLPFIIHGLWMATHHHYYSSKQLKLLVPFLIGLLLVVVHSFIGHKEFRFVLPVLPLTVPYVGYSVSHLIKWSKGVKALVYVLLFSNIPMCLYFCLVHQRGGYAIMRYLQHNVTSDSYVIFLMPCYSTPLYSHLHGDHVLKFLECLPEKGERNLEKEFYASPNEWLTVNMIKKEERLPTHIVCYDVLVPQIEKFLLKNSYVKIQDKFHAHFTDNEREGHHVLLYYRTS